MSEKTNVKIEKDLAEKVKIVAQRKFKFRNIEHNSEAVREVLIQFLKNNENLLKDSSNNFKEKQEAQTST